MHTVVKDEVVALVLGSKKVKGYFHVKLSLLYILSIPLCFMIDQLTIKSRNPFDKVLTVITVANIMFEKLSCSINE